MAPRTAHPPRGFTSVAGAAAYADVSTRTIRRYIADGTLPAYRVGSRMIRIDPRDLDRLTRRVPAAGNGAG